MRAISLALPLLFSIGTCSSSKCFPQCAQGFRQTPGACGCEPSTDAGLDDADRRVDADAAGDNTVLASCAPGTSCGSGSTCIEGCPWSAKPSIGAVPGICAVPGRDTCGCGAVVDPCSDPGTICLMPACCDYPGICVTPTERASICAQPEGAHFDCSAADAGA